MTGQVDYLTTSEVAALLRVPSETARYWRSVGRGPRSFKIPGGRRVLYARCDVEKWLADAPRMPRDRRKRERPTWRRRPREPRSEAQPQSSFTFGRRSADPPT